MVWENKDLEGRMCVYILYYVGVRVLKTQESVSD